MQNKPRSKKYNFLQPERIFTALLIAALLYLIPASHSREAAQQPGTLREYLPKLIPAVPGAGAQCAAECEVTVCLDWDPNPCGTHEWDIGCCLEYGTECDPGCSVDPDPGDGGGGGPSYQPPTISHVLNCSNSGVNGWCVGSLTLDLSASDPQGQTIIISGDIAGTPFACPNGQTTCPVPLPEGTGTANYRVDSATGLSAAGSTTYQLDATTPQINGNISGSIGTFDWFVTQAVSSASASDSLSGIASFEVSVDAAPYTNYQSPITFSDGVHTIQYRAYDNAGNYTETDAQEIKVDTAAPSLNVSTTGANGLNGWYISSVTLTPTASDSMSGIALLEISLDGGEWVAAESDQGTVISEGVHTVQFRATDNAGNVSQTAPQEIKVDTITPGLSLEVSGTRGQNDWYVSNVATTPTASDATSGVALVEMTVDGGLWTTISNNQLRLFTDGVHTYQYKVTDNAGNVTETPVLTVKVDTTAPILTAPTSLNVLEILRYQLSDPTSGLSQFSIHVADKDNVQPAAGNAWALTGNNSQGEYRWYATFGNGATAGVGLHPITLRVTDMAGNETTQSGYIEVTWQNLVYMEMTGKQTGGEASPAPSGSSGTITYTGGGSAAAPASGQQTSEVSETSEVAPAPPSFGGETNATPADSQTTTVTEGEAIPFAGVSIQTGTSFTSGSQTTNSQSPISTVLWGAAAAAMLGMTLADWQRRREEEAAALARYASSGEGGSDDDEMPEDVRARRRGKVIAKNEAKRAQESRWEAARQAKQGKDEEFFMQQTYKKILNAANVIPGMSAWREEQEEHVRQGGKPHYTIKPQVSIGNRDEASWKQWLLSEKGYISLPQSAVNPTAIPSQPLIYHIDGPMTIDQIPQEFLCTLPEKKIINGKELYSDYYYRCKLGEQLMVGLLTDPNGWWWQDGETKHWQTGNLTKWKGIKDNEDVWNLALALGLDSEGTDHRKQDSRFGELIEQAIFNKFWHFDHGVYSTYGNGVPDPDAAMPLGTNGRLVALGSLESLQVRVTGETGFVTRNVNASEVIRPPYDGYHTNMWEEAWNYFATNGEPAWKVPDPTSPYDIGNIKSDSVYFEMPIGENQGQVLYRNELSPDIKRGSDEDVRAIVLNYQQVQYQNAMGLR